MWKIASPAKPPVPMDYRVTPRWGLAGTCSLLAALLAVGIAAAESPVPDTESAAPEADQQWEQEGVPLVQHFCIDCHNTDYQEAELDLESFTSAASLAEERGHWEKVLQRVRFGSMPPEDAEQPTDEERARLIAVIEETIYGSACDLEPKPGRVTVRRLNRAEYNNTIRDLFGQDLRPADAFPSDEVGAGFDNNGDVLSLPPMLFERYMTAAEEIAAAVILDPDDVERIDTERSGDSLHVLGEARIGSFYKYYLLEESEDSFAWAEFSVPHAGEYRLRIAASAPREDEGPVALRVYDQQGEPVDTFEFKYADGGGSHSATTKVSLEAGEHRFLLARVAEKDAPEDRLEAADRLDADAIAAAREKLGKPLEVDRGIDSSEIRFAVKSLTLKGPVGTPEHLLPEGHKRLLKDHPSKKTSVAEAARPGIEWLLRRAFRSPVDSQTVDAYVGLVEQAHKREKSYERAMRVGVAAVLVSPRFLFRVELPPEGVAEGGTAPLNDHQLASRLSYFLWSSMPDDRLLQLADEGRLGEEEVLREEVQRMLDDPKAEALADNFAAQWLGLRNLATIEPDPEQFAEFDEALREAMRQETRLLFLDLMRRDRSMLDLLDADETFLNEPLARHYGIPGVEGNEFRKVSLAGTPRRGILTHGSVLTLTSNPTRTSPVKRGKWILENVLGTPPPDPPAGVPELEESAESNADAPLREQLEMHRADPSCASCHRTMDALGFGFEHFGVTGGYRDMDGPHPVDSSGELPGGVDFDGAVELIQILREQSSEQFVNTATQRLLTFALGRELKFEDRCVVDEIVEKSAKDDYRFSHLATEIVLSPAFRSHTLEGKQP